MTSRFFDLLIKSAQDFFGEALRQFEKGKLGLSIVSGYTTVELLMKARMCLIHDALRLDSLNQQKQGQTIKWSELIFRLEALGIPLSKEEKDLMRTISAWRNDLVHCVPTHDTPTARARLPELFGFISEFSKRELGDGRRLLTLAEKRQVLKAKQKAVNEQKAARKRAKASGKLIGLPCPNCGLNGTVTERAAEDESDEQAYCHYCERALYYRRCQFCPKKLLGAVLIDDHLMHDDCMDRYYSGYAEYLMDSRR